MCLEFHCSLASTWRWQDNHDEWVNGWMDGWMDGWKKQTQPKRKKGQAKAFDVPPLRQHLRSIASRRQPSSRLPPHAVISSERRIALYIVNRCWLWCPSSSFLPSLLDQNPSARTYIHTDCLFRHRTDRHGGIRFVVFLLVLLSLFIYIYIYRGRDGRADGQTDVQSACQLAIERVRRCQVCRSTRSGELSKWTMANRYV